MSRHALPCIKCGKPLLNVDAGGDDNQPHVGTEFTTFGHYGSTIHDAVGPPPRLELVVNICDTCILRAIEANVIQSRGERGAPPLLAHHYLDEEAKAWVLAQNEEKYGSAWGADEPQDYEALMRKAGWKLEIKLPEEFWEAQDERPG